MSLFPITYKISNQTIVTPVSSIWNEPIPENRQGHASSQDHFVSYGTYFQSVQTILEQNNFQLLQKALSVDAQKLYVTIKEVCIQLEKHGAFYHPARIVIRLADGQEKNFVANVACQKTGLGQLSAEAETLQSLGNFSESTFLPKYYGMGSAVIKNQSIALFLAEWLVDFYEFHVTSLSKQGLASILVWSPKGKNFLLTEKEKKELYRQCSYILCVFYDPFSCLEIFPWHHAAGDFVICKKEDGIFVKLISVRRYGPLFESEIQFTNLFQVFIALTCFLQTMAVKMGLDRYDGVGDLVFVGHEILPQIVEGFFQALQAKKLSHHDTPLVFLFQAFLLKNEKTWNETAQKVPFRLNFTDRSFLKSTTFLETYFRVLYLECLKWEPQNV